MAISNMGFNRPRVDFIKVLQGNMLTVMQKQGTQLGRQCSCSQSPWLAGEPQEAASQGKEGRERAGVHSLVVEK
jgi:hypothetical protein